MNEAKPPEAVNWWRDWGRSVAFLVLAIVGVVAAMALAVWVVTLIF